MFDYHCNWCGYNFFLEEGYDENLDEIICPHCKAAKCHCEYFIQEV